MDRLPVISFKLRSIGYDYASAVLEVEYNTGEIIRLAGVPRHQYYDLLNARDYGDYLEHRLKPFFRWDTINCLLPSQKQQTP